MNFLKLFVVFVGFVMPIACKAGEIRVTGQAYVERVPDMATITLGVSHQADNAKDAIAEVAVLSGAMLASLKDMGVAERDMRTSDLSLQPVWQRSNSSNQPPKVTGYSASNRVTVRVRDLAILGDILGRVTTDGANLFQGLQFGLQDNKPALNEARKLAVADAMARAELYATAAGVGLGPVLSISEPGGSGPMPVMAMREAMSADVAMPIAQGELSVAASVTLVFEIAE